MVKKLNETDKKNATRSRTYIILPEAVVNICTLH